MGLTVKNESDRTTVLVYGEIGDYFGVTAAELRSQLQASPSGKPLEVRVDSVGGDFYEAISIRSELRRHNSPVAVYVDGLAASAGSLIAMAGDTIEMSQGAWMMIHEVHASISNASEADLLEAASRVGKMNQQIADIYKPRWKAEASLADALAAETWLSDSEAVEAGLADTVATEAIAAAAKVDAAERGFSAVPEVLKTKPIDFTTYKADGLRVISEFLPTE